VPRVLEDDLLRGRLLAAMPDPQIRAMWRTYFTPLDHRFRLEIINPVQPSIAALDSVLRSDCSDDSRPGLPRRRLLCA
jgi:hypothetical protein